MIVRKALSAHTYGKCRRNGSKKHTEREGEEPVKLSCNTKSTTFENREGTAGIVWNIHELSTQLTGAMNCNQNTQQMYSWQSALAVFVPAMKARLAAISTEQPVAPVSLGASMASLNKHSGQGFQVPLRS